MKWIKKGLIFCPDGEQPWMQQYAQVPTPLVLEDRIRIYFTTRGKADINGNFISNTTFIEVDKNNPKKILYIHNKPVVELGELGAFDEFGIMPGDLIIEDNRISMLYTGWSRLTSVPFSTCIGKVISFDGGISFTKPFKGPFIGLGGSDHLLINGPFHYKDTTNSVHIFYASGKEWINADIKPEIQYLIKHGRFLTDNENFVRDNTFCVPLLSEKEAQNRPSLIKIEDIFYLFFSYRLSTGFRNQQNGYKLGLAKSYDLIKWNRCDEELNLTLSDSGWDSQMMAYPYPLKVDDKIYLFYNGNFFGKDGFGYAELMKKVKT